MKHFGIASLLVFAVVPLPAADPPQVPADHAASMAASQAVFKESVREFFVKNCLECHGGEKTKSGFNLVSREKMLEGGDRGAAVVPGKGKESRLVKLVARTEEPHMPPKQKVGPEVVAALTKWIDLGAAFDKPLKENADTSKKPMAVTEKDKQYWAYRPLATTSPPVVQNKGWAKNPIDQFILAKLEAAKITPAGDADKRTLIRRVTFDLTGLPPTLDEVQAFVDDKDATAFEKVVDRLLASTAYGERWGRHWLDPARYAESHGFEHDYFRPHAYHYRDWVIKALNADTPYDQFVRMQLAGDEVTPNDPDALAATGFLGAGVFPTQITNREAERIRYDAMDDMLATTGHTFLALTVGCARCHDHKYDPIPQKDYYRLLSAFTTTVRSEVELDLSTPEQKKAFADWEAKRKPLEADVKRYEVEDLGKAFGVWLGEGNDKLPAIEQIKDVKVATTLKTLLTEKKKFADLPKSQKDQILKWFAPQDTGWKDRQAKLTDHDKQKPPLSKVTIQATTEGRKPMRHHTADGSIPDFYPKTFLLKRGDTEQKAEEVNLGVLQVLARTDEKAWVVEKPPTAATSFRRLSLANWITDTKDGAGSLAARVMVNRLWHHHFGRGIVSTLNDFGFQGDPPTHPELLEWLANDLVSHGWKLKRVHKLMVMSRTYQLSGAVNAESLKVDPDNRLWWHRPKRRLEAEAIRDNWLAVSGQLDRTMYGPGEANEGMKRRSVYFRIQRSQMIPALQVFDWPDSLTSAAARPVTTTSPQALFFLNNPHVRAAAAAFAAKLKPLADKNPAEAVERAYLSAFGRPPTKDELAIGVEYVAGKGDKGLHSYAQALFGLNEFVYID
ncbi:MAG: PSD1 and planctomycete cytochrome C domain-containing protein [Fimbriiglobus sp.]|nr:PSD1 and planctomycete cytochrome C domain-containing protein [Fimbriiglobus sp.]